MARRKILVVDDEESMRYFLNRSLKRKGYLVSTVESGEEALTAVENDPPDLILLDLHLPGMDGIEVLRELRRRETLPQVLLMTGFGTVERALEAMREGAADFVSSAVVEGEDHIDVRAVFRRLLGGGDDILEALWEAREYAYCSEAHPLFEHPSQIVDQVRLYEAHQGVHL